MISDAHPPISRWQHQPELLDQLLATLTELAPQTDQEGLFPEQAFLELADAGLLAVTLPNQPLDGATPNTPALLNLLKRIGAANLAVGRVYEGHLNALLLVHQFGTVNQKKQWFDAVLNRQSRLSVWNTQAADGVKIHALGSGVYELEGCKTFCSGAGWIDRPLLTGDLLVGGKPQGWQMCILPPTAINETAIDGRFWKPLGMRASASFKIDFTGIRISGDDLLGQPGDYLRQPYFSGGAIRFAAVQLGGAEAMLDATRELLQSMGRTDDPLQRARLADMAILIETGNLWLKQAGENTDNWLMTTRTEIDQAMRVVAYANMTRTAIEGICLDVMRLAERCVGARGLLRPMPFERIHRDLTMYLRQPAPDATLTDIGRYVLDQTTPANDLWT